MRTWIRWGIVLGFALGGFFDGILLHQILQWHHLLSLVPEVDSLRAQILWDGYFHALMYLIAIAGIWGLWCSRRVAPQAPGRALAGALLVGSGAWHLVDGILSHWLLGIHRIKLDSPDPLLWDLAWAAGFGLVPVVIGWLLLRRGGSAAGRVQGSGMAIGLAGLLASALAAWSLRPPADQPFTTVVFAPGIDAAAAMNAIVAADARLVWSDPAMGVVVVDAPAENRLGFYRDGALLVGGSGLPSGCFNWSRAAA